MEKRKKIKPPLNREESEYIAKVSIINHDDVIVDTYGENNGFLLSCKEGEIVRTLNLKGGMFRTLERLNSHKILVIPFYERTYVFDLESPGYEVSLDFCSVEANISGYRKVKIVDGESILYWPSSENNLVLWNHKNGDVENYSSDTIDFRLVSDLIKIDDNRYFLYTSNCDLAIYSLEKKGVELSSKATMYIKVAIEDKEDHFIYQDRLPSAAVLSDDEKFVLYYNFILSQPLKTQQPLLYKELISNFTL